MALEQKLHLKLAQRLVMTPTLQQAIKLLQLSRLELEQALDQELQVNPMLEMSEDPLEGDESGSTGDSVPDSPGAAEPIGEGQESRSEAVDSAGEENGDGEVVRGESFGEVELESLFANYLHDSATLAPTWAADDDSQLDGTPTPEPSLYEALSQQLGLSEVSDELRPVCEFLIGNLDADGYLRLPLDEAAAQLGVSSDHVGAALRAVQSLEPPGIGARSLQECFLLQLDRGLPDGRQDAAADLTRRLVAESFPDLLHQRWEVLGARFSVSRSAFMAVTEVLRRLQTRPGGLLGPTVNTAVEPDVMVRREGDRWRVTLNDDGLPRLRISPQYLRLLRSRSLDSSASGYLRERMRSALWFLRSVEQRQNTVLRVSEAIVERQKAFLEKGLSHLRPLVLRDIADDIGMHESTVSRVVSNKHMDTPRGVYPLKFFFHSAISHAVTGDISSVVVKERVRELVAEEDPVKPLSDARIARLLNRVGIRIARRTVAKYREEIGLPSSEQRRRRLR